MEICENWNQLLKEWNCLISLQPAISNSFNSFHSSLWEWEEWLNWWMLRPLAAQENVLNGEDWKSLKWKHSRGELAAPLFSSSFINHQFTKWNWFDWLKKKGKQMEKNCRSSKANQPTFLSISSALRRNGEKCWFVGLAEAGNAINNFTFLFMKKKSLLLIGLPHAAPSQPAHSPRQAGLKSSWIVFDCLLLDCCWGIEESYWLGRHRPSTAAKEGNQTLN